MQVMVSYDFQISGSWRLKCSSVPTFTSCWVIDDMNRVISDYCTWGDICVSFDQYLTVLRMLTILSSVKDEFVTHRANLSKAFPSRLVPREIRLPRLGRLGSRQNVHPGDRIILKTTSATTNSIAYGHDLILYFALQGYAEASLRCSWGELETIFRFAGCRSSM